MLLCCRRGCVLNTVSIVEARATVNATVNARTYAYVGVTFRAVQPQYKHATKLPATSFFVVYPPCSLFCWRNQSCPRLASSSSASLPLSSRVKLALCACHNDIQYVNHACGRSARRHARCGEPKDRFRTTSSHMQMARCFTAHNYTSMQQPDVASF